MIAPLLGFNRLVSVKPITILFTFPSFAWFLKKFKSWQWEELKEETVDHTGKTKHHKNKTVSMCPRLNRVTQAWIHSGQVNFTTVKYCGINQGYLLTSLFP